MATTLSLQNDILENLRHVPLLPDTLSNCPQLHRVPRDHALFKYLEQYVVRRRISDGNIELIILHSLDGRLDYINLYFREVMCCPAHPEKLVYVKLQSGRFVLKCTCQTERHIMKDEDLLQREIVDILTIVAHGKAGSLAADKVGGPAALAEVKFDRSHGMQSAGNVFHDSGLPSVGCTPRSDQAFRTMQSTPSSPRSPPTEGYDSPVSTSTSQSGTTQTALPSGKDVRNYATFDDNVIRTDRLQKAKRKRELLDGEKWLHPTKKPSGSAGDVPSSASKYIQSWSRQAFESLCPSKKDSFFQFEDNNVARSVYDHLFGTVGVLIQPTESYRPKAIVRVTKLPNLKSVLDVFPEECMKRRFHFRNEFVVSAVSSVLVKFHPVKGKIRLLFNFSTRPASEAPKEAILHAKTECSLETTTSEPSLECDEDGPEICFNPDGEPVEICFNPDGEPAEPTSSEECSQQSSPAENREEESVVDEIWASDFVSSIMSFGDSDSRGVESIKAVSSVAYSSPNSQLGTASCCPSLSSSESASPSSLEGEENSTGQL